VLEGAYHADETCKALAVRIAVEHVRFETWSRECGLNDAAIAEAEADAATHGVAVKDPKARRFEAFLKYSGPVITPVLSEILLLMTQLTSTEQKYSEVIGFNADKTTFDATRADQNPTADMTDIMEPTVQLGAHSIEQLLRQKDEVLNLTPHLLMEPYHQSTSERPRARAKRTKQAWKDNTLIDIASRVTRTAKTALEPKRLQWKIIDEPKCDQKIQRLSQLNGFLLECLDRTDRTDVFQMILLQMNTNKDLVQHVRALIDAIKAPKFTDAQSGMSGTTLVATDQDRASMPDSRDFIRQAGNFVIAVLEAAGQPSGLSKLQAMLSDETVSLSSRTPARMADGQEVWIEWKKYQKTMNDDGMLAIDPLTDGRMERLVTVLKTPTKPKEFCVPPCLGYFVDEPQTRIGVVFQAPAGVSVRTPRSLLDLFEQQPTASLSSKICTARALALWLLHLHSVRWLHKGIRSASVLFFTPEGSPELDNPYITGFEYARTTGDPYATTKPPIGVDTNDFYVHPDYLEDHRAAGYRQIYDIYSLGIVLIELAYWQPIDRILKEAVAARGLQTPLKPGAVRSQVLGKSIDVLEGVRSRVGGRYTAAVEACLNGLEASNENGMRRATESENNAVLLYEFNERVIEMLAGIVM
jgi:hypothetical protein